jgi:hypothetical protein
MPPFDMAKQSFKLQTQPVALRGDVDFVLNTAHETSLRSPTHFAQALEHPRVSLDLGLQLKLAQAYTSLLLK